MSRLSTLKRDIRAKGSSEKAKIFARFFKTGPGQYGEGDHFVGVTVPELRAIAKRYRDLPLHDLTLLLHCKEHEYRLASLLILNDRFLHASPSEQKHIYELYMANTEWINNWDLVDASAPYILGPYLRKRSKAPLRRLAKSSILWERRIAMIATFACIRAGESKTALQIAEILIDDPHDLIQKAVGWMLREVGKRVSLKDELRFLDRHAATMPRMALRYSIERFSHDLYTYYLSLRKLRVRFIESQ